MRILVVDDSMTMRRILVNSLHRIGFTDCVEAGDADEALSRFDPSIGCVITDWNMPGLSGPDFVHALHNREDGANVPVIMVTVRSSREDIMEAARAGANNYIVKPFTPVVLHEKIQTVLTATGGTA